MILSDGVWRRWFFIYVLQAYQICKRAGKTWEVTSRLKRRNSLLIRVGDLAEKTNNLSFFNENLITQMFCLLEGI